MERGLELFVCGDTIAWANFPSPLQLGQGEKCGFSGLEATNHLALTAFAYLIPI